MFTTLVESRPVRKRSTRGALASMLVHGTVIASAVALTRPNPGNATSEPDRVVAPTYVNVTPPVPSTPAPRTPQAAQPELPAVPRTIVIAPDLAPPNLTFDIASPVTSHDQIDVGVSSIRTGPTRPDTPGPGSGDIVDVDAVERAPHMLGNAPAPHYPAALREAGVDGNVVLRFVIDTLGRAEADGVVILQATHPLFADAVKNVLGRYRFRPGEVGSRKVRTMVQQSFTFTLR